MRTERVYAGFYRYSAGGYVVEVFTREGNPAYGDPPVMWIAVALWTQHLYSDPVPTKREAVRAARQMLNDKLAKVN